MNNIIEENEYTGLEIAVIGMAGRFPGAASIAGFWNNLKNEVESITFFTGSELAEAGIANDMLTNPDYVKAMAVLADIEQFDAAFFEYTPTTAEAMDPQVRLFHECAYHALEDAGYVPGTYDGLIGLYAGASDNFYWKSLAVLSGKGEELGQFEVQQLTNKDYLCARTAYKLNLKGPVVSVQSACSTSLVAIHMACQGLISGETDIALAGGVTIIPIKTGYLYQEGMILSPDGHCRAFDSQAKGTIGGNGLGIVVLKRLEDATADGDHIYAVIKGSAINNDGLEKIGFTAPGVEGQSEVIKEALRTAQVKAESIVYIEAHGTGTVLGDPVEFEALRLAFNTGKKGFCGLGSVKTNVGHLDSAAGVAGFIKTVLVLKHKVIPASLHFRIPNNKLNLIDSPFYVNADLTYLERGTYPLRAGVSSLGIGGTNAHVILEEYKSEIRNRVVSNPKQIQNPNAQNKTQSSKVFRGVQGGGFSKKPPWPAELIILSAKTKTALDNMTKNLADYLKERIADPSPSISLNDAAYTLQVGRQAYKHRRIAVCSTLAGAAASLSSPEPANQAEAPDNVGVIAGLDKLISEIGENRGNREGLLNKIGQLWLEGQQVDWQALHGEGKGRRVSLPAYPFERQYYWIEGNPYKLGADVFSQDQAIAKKTDMAGWFYLPSWERTNSLCRNANRPLDISETSSWLVFSDEAGIGSAVTGSLAEKGLEIVKVTMGDEFGKVSKQPGKDSNLYEYELNPRRSGDYDRLLNELSAMGKLPGNILHLWALSPEEDGGNMTDSFDSFQYRGFYSLIFLTKAIDKLAFGEEIRINVVTSGVQDVTGRDSLRPEAAPVLGAVKVIPQEFPYLICRCIDIDIPGPGSPRMIKLAEQLVSEFYSQPFEPVIAYRGDYRWQQTYIPLHLEKPEEHIPGLRNGGVYLVFGGTGKIGFALSRYLAGQVGAKLILVGRSQVPVGEQGEQWLNSHPGDDPMAKKILQVKQLEESGSEVLVLAADVADPAQVEEVFVRAEAQFGRIDGVIHAAGDTGESISRAVEHLEEEDCNKQFRARVYGLTALEKALLHRELDFCLILSSLVSVLGGLGFAAYAAAVIFMDTFVHSHNRRHAFPWTVMNTAEWLFKKVAAPTNRLAAEMLELSMTEAEGVETFARIFSHCKETQVVVSTGDLPVRIKKWIKLEDLHREQPAGNDGLPSLHPRPVLSRPYIPAGNRFQHRMALTWQKFFRIEPVGIDDDFFELGGDSLKVITLVAKIHKEFNAKISIEEFFRRPTVRGLAEYMESGKNDKEEQRYAAIEPVEKREYYILSSAQKRLFLMQQFDLNSIAYNIPLVLPFGKEIKKEMLETALQKLIRRHESLRASFTMVNNQPVQRIHNPEDIDFEVEYLVTGVREQGLGIRKKQETIPGIPSPGGVPLHRSPDIAGLISQFIRPFDLGRPPLLRSALIEFPDGRHIWITDIHHIVSDGTSLTILTEDFFNLYNGIYLLPLRLQYKDFSAWQNHLFSSGQVEEEESYWLELYRDAAHIPRLELPADFRRPEVFTFAGAGYRFMLDREDVVNFKALGSQHKATLYMNMLTILNILFYKYTGQDDIILGTVVEGRPHADIETIIGMFVNTLAMRNYPRGDKTYTSFLREVAGRSLNALENQDVQFEELVDRLGVERELSGNPLFDVTMVIQNFRRVRGAASPGGKPGSIEEALPEAEAEIEYKKDTAKFDLTFFIYETGEDELSIYIEYYTGIFKEETIERLSGHLRNLIKAVVKEPGVTLDNIDLLSAEEKKQVLYEFNDTTAAYPGDKSIPQLFAEQVKKRPHRIALVGEGHLDYRELHDKAGHLTYTLIEKGIKKDMIAGLMVERSIEMIIGILAILKAGAAYLPIDTGYPEERIDYMLADSGTKILLTTGNLIREVEKFKNLHVKTIIIEEKARIRNQGRRGSARFCVPPPLNTGSDVPAGLAYVMYTSGTTGNPKGVLIDHFNVIRVVRNTNFININTSDRVLQLSNYAFDGSVFDIYGALLNGVPLVLVDKERVSAVDRLAALIKEEQVTVFFITAALFNTLVDFHMDCLMNVRKVLFGGERASVEHSRQALEFLGRGRLINGYGPTETTVFAASYPVDNIPGTAVSIPIGKPIANTTVYILTKNMQPVPIGVNGEIYIGGEGTARGYLNNPELTAEKFIASGNQGGFFVKPPPKQGRTQCVHPNFTPCFVRNSPRKTFIIKSFWSHLFTKRWAAGGKLYKTGDIGRWLPGGNIEFIDRIDHQIKLRGFRIELGEIEHRLLEHRDIKEAVVIDKGTGGSDTYLCAYIAGMHDPGDTTELRDYLSRSLPDYMIPSYFVTLDRIPLTANGKVDRKALPAPEIRIEEGFTAPQSDTEKQLAAAWSEILAIDKEKIGIDSNFFELGGHSLKATMLTARIHSELGVRVPLTEVFKTRTIRGLSKYIDLANKTGYAGINPVERREYYPLSSAQKRLFFLRQLDPDSTTYNMPLVLPLSKDVDPDGIETALKKLIERHESLRTSFIMVAEKPVQRVHDPENIDFEVEFASGGPPFCKKVGPKTFHEVQERRGEPCVPPFLDTEPGARQLIEQFVRPFDLDRPPLLRSALIKLPDHRYLWLVDMHHIISDGASQTILTKDFMTLFKGEEPQPLRQQYKDFSHWQNRLFAGERIKVQEEYWFDVFPKGKEIPRLQLPVDYPRPEVFTFAGANYGFTLAGEEAEKLKALGVTYNATLFMNILSVLNILFYKYAGGGDIIIGSGIAGRNHAELQPIMGMFVNALALRNFPRGEKTCETFLKEVVTHSIKAFENQDIQFEALVEKLDIARDTSRNPLFDILMVVQNFEPAAALEGLLLADDLSFKKAGYKSTGAKFDMTFSISENDDGIHIGIEYYTAIFKETTIKRLASHFKNIIGTVINNPVIALQDIEIMPDEEKRQVLYGFNDTAGEYPVDKTIYQLFAEQVEKNPDYIALSGRGYVAERQATAAEYSPFQPLHLDYRELHDKAGHLTYRLNEKGVKKDMIVGLMVERSTEMIIGILAILKAGSAYLPIEPSSPVERIDYMLADSGTKFLLTTGSLREDVSKLAAETIFIEKTGIREQGLGIKTVETQNLASQDVDRKPRPVGDAYMHPSGQNRRGEPRVPPSMRPEAGVEFPSHGGVAAGLAYIIYTSGSTGRPKGVPVEHRSVVNLLTALQRSYPLTKSGVFLLKTSYVFDVSVAELFGWFLAGGRLAVLEKDGEKDPLSILTAIETAAVTHINFVPSMFNIFVDALNSRNIAGLSSLKYIFAAGEALLPELVNKFKRLKTDVSLENLYGPTEGTVYVSNYSLSHWEGQGNVPIGKPMRNMGFIILGKDNDCRPIGVPGELCISGSGLAMGYLNNPELTAEKFIASVPPFCKKVGPKTFDEGREPRPVGDAYMRPEPGVGARRAVPGGVSIIPGVERSGTKLYKTGDLARWLPDGNVEFLGRIDHQVKVRGFRIELGEIETRLLQRRDIKEAVVIDRATRKGDKYLCAYIVIQGEAHVGGRPSFVFPRETESPGIDETELREFLLHSLPDYMIPSYFVTLDKIPLTDNGKVDRKALPAPEISIEEGFIAPRSESEKKLAVIWSETLGIDKEKIGAGSNFFELGGHSLTAAVITAKIFKEFGAKVPVTVLFKYKTIRCLDSYLRTLGSEEFVSIKPLARKEYYELSFNQKRIWIIQQKDLLDNSYNMPARIVMKQKVSEEIIKKTVANILDRHESLSTGFKEIDGEAVQYVVEEYDLPFTAVDISGMEETKKEDEIKRILAGFELAPFHLDEAPLFKTLLLKTGDERYILAYNMHHIISDGWSLGILERDFRRIYDIYLKGGTSRPGPDSKAITYKDFSAWHNKLLKDPYQKKVSHEFWLTFLREELPLLRLPVDSDSRGKEKKGARFRFVLGNQVKDALKQLGKKHNITLFALLYSIYNLFLAILSGQRMIVTSIVNAGRDHPLLLEMVGFFVNAVPFRKEIDYEDAFIDFAGDIQAAVLDFFKHQHYPIELVLDETGLKYPEIAASFNMVNIGNTETVPLNDLESYHKDETQNVKFDIEPYISEYSNGIEIDTAYDRNLFDADNIAYMMGKYRKLIEFFASHPGKQLKDWKEKKKKKLIMKN